MAPGVHCLQPNALASYARSSPLMRRLHSIVGDGATREMLVGCVVLVPAVSSAKRMAAAAKKKKAKKKGGGSSEAISSSLFDCGNYFQLCGPPLNVLAKKFEGMGEKSFLDAAAAGVAHGDDSGLCESQRQNR